MFYLAQMLSSKKLPCSAVTVKNALKIQPTINDELNIMNKRERKRDNYRTQVQKITRHMITIRIRNYPSYSINLYLANNLVGASTQKPES